MSLLNQMNLCLHLHPTVRHVGKEFCLLLLIYILAAFPISCKVNLLLSDIWQDILLSRITVCRLSQLFGFYFEMLQVGFTCYCTTVRKVVMTHRDARQKEDVIASVKNNKFNDQLASYVYCCYSNSGFSHSVVADCKLACRCFLLSLGEKLWRTRNVSWTTV